MYRKEQLEANASIMDRKEGTAATELKLKNKTKKFIEFGSLALLNGGTHSINYCPLRLLLLRSMD